MPGGTSILGLGRGPQVVSDSPVTQPGAARTVHRGEGRNFQRGVGVERGPGRPRGGAPAGGGAARQPRRSQEEVRSRIGS